ncbi:MAG: hypothetical protein GYB66_04395 [Chloroflexi bacterium]|nr:hypothetical protein [Chloroflexota bacterium]
MNSQLDFETLKQEIAETLSPEAGYWVERLLHTYVGNPVAGLYTQVEIIQRVIERRPEMLPGEVENLKTQVKHASDNIVTIVRALAAAFNSDD